MIKIPSINPIRFKEPIAFLSKESCYKQKFEKEDYTRLQIQSDEEEVFYEVVNAETLEVVDTVQFSKINTLIVNYDYSIFEADVFFNLYDEGDYFIRIGNHESYTIEIRKEHRLTQLYTYKNSENNFGIVFDTGIVFRTRVESRIENFSPSFDNEIYNDEKRNATKLYSLPFRIFTLYVGSGKGIAGYMTDLINMVMSCDMVKIDNEWVELTEGSEWEYHRAENYKDFAMSIEIMPSENRMMEKLIIDKIIEDGEDMIIQRYSNNYTDIEEGFSIENTFVKNVVLNYVTVFRKTSAFLLKIGTTEGGSEIAEVLIDSVIQTINLNHYFTESKTLFIEGFNGANDISLVWDRFDKFINPNQSTSTPVNSLGKGACIFWYGTEEELEENFNIVTGLGKYGSDWEDWAICDGQNGTTDDRGRVVVGFTDEATGAIGSVGGADFRHIVVENLPSHTHKMFTNGTVTSSTSSNLTSQSFVAKGTTSSGRRDEKYAMRQNGTAGGTTIPSVGNVSFEGGGEGLDIRQKYIVKLPIMKIA